MHLLKLIQTFLHYYHLITAWEKKTDITTAINIATKKRLDLLVQELRTKLASLSSVTHTSVKEAKERHLGSKALKTELESLACQRFQQVKELSTKNVVSTIRQWAIRKFSLFLPIIVWFVRTVARTINNSLCSTFLFQFF